jgi:hypothetical protein
LSTASIIIFIIVCLPKKTISHIEAGCPYQRFISSALYQVIMYFALKFSNRHENFQIQWQFIQFGTSFISYTPLTKRQLMAREVTAIFLSRIMFMCILVQEKK